MGKLHDAAANGDLETIKEMLTTNPNSIKEPESVKGALPIVCAAIGGQLEAFKLLFKNGFPTPTDAIDNGKSGMALIHFACSGGCVEIVKILLNSGFSLDTKTVNGMTVMHSAACGSKEMMEFLNEKGFSYEVEAKGRTPLEIAAKTDQLEIVQFLLTAGISPKNLLTKKRRIVSWCGEKVKKFLQDHVLAEASPNPQQKVTPVAPASKPTLAVAAIPNATPRSIPFTTELSLGVKPVVVSQKPSDSILSSLHEPLDKLRNERVTPPNKKSTPAPQKLLSQNPRLSSFPQRIDELRSKQVTTLPERVITLEKRVTELEADKQKQQQEIEVLKAKLKELEESLTQRPTSTAPRVSNGPKPWTPAFDYATSSTSPSTLDVQISGSNDEGRNLQALSFVAIKPEPTETDNSPKHKKRSMDENAEMPSPKR